MSFFLQIKRSPVKVRKNPFKQMTLALPIETDRQNLLAGLRHSSLVRDDSGKHRVYRDEEEIGNLPLVDVYPKGWLWNIVVFSIQLHPDFFYEE